MHVALVSVFGLPASSSEDERRRTRVGLARLAEAAAERNVPLAVSPSGPALELLAADPDLLARLRLPSIEWVRAGWAFPSFPMLTERAASLLLAAEADTLARMGVEAGGLLITEAWDAATTATLVRNRIPYALLPVEQFAGPGAGVADHLEEVLTVLPWQPLRASLEAGLATACTGEDGLAVLTLDPGDDPAAAIRRVLDTPGCDLTTPRAFLAAHRVRGRAPLAAPLDWRAGLRASPAAELLHRKMVRLTTRLPERLPAAAEEQVRAALEGAAYRPEAPAAVRRAAHVALVRARRIIDEDRRRGDDWGRTTRLDWDADGAEDVHVELPELSVVVDPEAAALVSVDLKPVAWPVSYVPGEGPWSILRHLPDGPAGETGTATSTSLEVASVEEARGTVALELSGPLGDGQATCRLHLSGHSLRLAVTLEGAPPGRVGPELVLALPECRLRVDGGAWSPVDEPLAREGHRFRLSGEGHDVLVSSVTPAAFFARPAEDGVVAWPHWLSSGNGTYEATVELT
jgi:hypothetical protein